MFDFFFFLILKQHGAGRKEERKRRRRRRNRKREDMERNTDMEKRVLIIAICVWVCGITGTGSPNDVFAQYARVENSNQSSTGI